MSNNDTSDTTAGADREAPQLRPVGRLELIRLYQEANPSGKQLAEAKTLVPSTEEMERFARERGLTLQSISVPSTEALTSKPRNPKSMSDDELMEDFEFQKSILHGEDENGPRRSRMEDRLEELANEMENRRLGDYAHLSGSTSTPPLAAIDISNSGYASPEGKPYKSPDGGSYLPPQKIASGAAAQPPNLPTTQAFSDENSATSNEVPFSEIPFKELVDYDLGPIPDTIDGWKRRIATLKMIIEGHDDDLGPRSDEDRKLLRDYYLEAEDALNSLVGYSPDEDDRPESGTNKDDVVIVKISDDEVQAAQRLWEEFVKRSVTASYFGMGDNAAAFDSLASLIPATQNILKEHPATLYFEPVAMELLDLLESLLETWHGKFGVSTAEISDSDRLKFQQQLNRCRARLYGIQKSLDSIRQRRRFPAKWFMPNEVELDELYEEFGTPPMDQEETAETIASQVAKKEVGGKFVASREASEAELCLNIDIYAAAVAQTFQSAAEEKDFVFALYAPWGRGKSTLISKVTDLLSLQEKTKADSPYEPVIFSAWKYPSRPEVWVHLYQCLAAKAQAGGWLQKTRISLRMGLVKNGWWPLLSGFGLLAVSRLQLEFAHWLLDGMGIIGLLILGSFIWNAMKSGGQLAHFYFTMPDHAEKLGLQAVIGEDVKHLLEVWARPQPMKSVGCEKPPTWDFSGSWVAFWSMCLVVIFIWSTLGLVAWKIHNHLPNLQTKPPSQMANIATTSLEAGAESKPTSVPLEPKKAQAPMRIEIKAEFQGAKINWAGMGPLQKEEPNTGSTKLPKSVLLLDVLFGLIALATPILAVLISSRPRQCRRVLLVVDDLDRCDPDQMLAVIESLRLFLDEPEMSRRLQVAMLLDRNILKSAMVKRAEAQKLLLAPESQAEFFRQQEEKLFVVSMTLPPIDHDMLATLARRMVKREVQQQAVDAPAPPPGQEKRASSPDNSTDSMAAQLTPTASSNEGPQNPPPTTPKRPAVSNDQAVRRILSDVQFSQEEQDLLVEALTKFDVSNITPRSYRAFVLRYQLVRLILAGFAAHYEPSEVIAEIASRLFKCKNAMTSPSFSAAVLTAINSVVISNSQESPHL